MSLANASLMLARARQGRYAVGGFNVFDYLSMQSVVEAAAELASPAILQTLPPVVKRFGAATLAAWARELAARCPALPLALHLDHGTDPDLVEEAIRDGYTSVMFDGSALPFEENIRLSRRLVGLAHARGLTVEGEVGCILLASDRQADRESPDRLATAEGCRRYVTETGVDSLAPAIGTAHGLYRDAPHLDCERLSAIQRACDLPLVIHGGTGLSAEDFRRLIGCGAAKINIATQLRLEYLQAMAAFPSAHPGSDEPLEFFADAATRIRARVQEFIGLFGSGGKA
jgi:ketose-bisphosphate aldolase